MPIARFQDVRLGHVHFRDGSACWPGELVSFILLGSFSNAKSITYILVQYKTLVFLSTVNKSYARA